MLLLQILDEQIRCHCYKYWTLRSDEIVTNTGQADKMSLLQILYEQIRCHCYKYWTGRSDVIVTNTNIKTSLLKHLKAKFHNPSTEVDLYLVDKQT
jgi:prenyltransferase beta subunit